MIEKFREIKCFVFDVDGVLTNGNLLVMPGGTMLRTMNVKDGYALQLAVKKGYIVIVISGGNSAEVAERLNKLGISDVYMQTEDKLSLLKSLMEKYSLSPKHVLFMGDDMPDYALLTFAGLPCCPADAVPEIKKLSKYISPYKGGEGCARNVIEMVLKLRGDWSVDAHIRAQ
jgi:3-deoxy-D-manno-octulosonate 8-phosphate phosphatase (KDO 8-P phosphatase)